MITVSGQKIRLQLDASQWYQSATDLVTNASPNLANGADLRLELCFSYGALTSDAQLASTTNWGSLTVALKDSADRSGLAYWSQTLGNSQLNAGITYANWVAGTDQTAVVRVPSSANNLFVESTTKTCWLVVEANTVNTETAVAALAVNAGGTGYAAGDILTVSGGTSTGGNVAQIQVSTVDGSGVILTALVLQGGAYTAQPSNPAAATGGRGSGATFNLTWTLLPSRTIPVAAFPVTVTELGLGTYPPTSVSSPTYWTAAQSDARYLLSANLNSYALLAGATFTGAVVLPSGQMSGATGLYAATKAYVDSAQAAAQAASVPNTGTSTVAGLKTFSSLLTASAGLTVSGTTTLGSLSGVLKAAAGAVAGSATTSDLTEGSNLYFTTARTLATALTGYSASSGTIAATDTVLQAFNKVGYALANAFAGATTTTVASQAAMLALSASVKGDLALRSDANVTYVYKGGGYAVLANWAQLLNPVASVNGATGVVVLTTDNVAEGSTNLYYTAARADARITAQKGVANGLCPLNSSSVVPAANLPTTDGITEGSTNLFFTQARVLATPLTGFSASAGTVASTDTVLQAFNKLAGNSVGAALLAGATFSGTVAFSGTTNPGLIVNHLSTTQIGALSTGAGNYGNIVYDTTANQLKALVNGSYLILSATGSFLPLSAGASFPLTGKLVFQDALGTAIDFGSNVWTMRTSGSDAELDVQCSGTTVFSLLNSQDVVVNAGNLKMGANKVIDQSLFYYDSGGHKILDAQQAAVADAAYGSGTATNNGYGFADATEFNNYVTAVNNAILQLNTLLAKMRAHGLIAT